MKNVCYNIGMNLEKFRQNLGKKVIFRNRHGYIIEATVMSVDPTGTAVKLKDGLSDEEWYDVETIQYISTLNEPVTESGSGDQQLIEG
jgi:hypothetical protein